MHLYFLLHLHSHLRLYSHLHLHLRSWARGTVAPNHRSTSRVQTCRMSLIWQMYLCEKLADSGKMMGGTRLLCFVQGLCKHIFHFIGYFVLHRFDSISEIFQSILTNLSSKMFVVFVRHFHVKDYLGNSFDILQVCFMWYFNSS